jgi:hypothetical protein
MKKRVQLAMLLGTFALTMVSCDKDDNQLEIKKETKVNSYNEDELDHDWGHPPIKPPKINSIELEVDHDWGHPPIKPPKINSIEQEVDHDWGHPPIKPPKINSALQNNIEQEVDHDWGHPPIKPPKKQ